MDRTGCCTCVRSAIHECWGIPATIESVEVVDLASDKPSGTNRVVSAKDEDVTGQVKLLSLPSTLDKANYSTTLKGGESGVMFFDVTFLQRRCRAVYFCPSRPRPASGKQAFAGINGDESADEDQLTGGNRSLPSFQGRWLGRLERLLPRDRAASICDQSDERNARSFRAICHRLDQDRREGKAFRGDGKKPEDWLCYGVDFLAVAPGTVVEAMRDLPDQPPGVAPTNLTVPEIAGNHVILDLGGGRYAMYAHLAPHSVTVHVGDHVRAGDKLGLLGNSGNTTGPHLHFQISDRPSTLDTTSLPFVFETHGAAEPHVGES